MASGNQEEKLAEVTVASVQGSYCAKEGYTAHVNQVNRIVHMEVDALPPWIPHDVEVGVFSLVYDNAESIVYGNEKDVVLERVPLGENGPFFDIIMDRQTAEQIDGVNPQLRKKKNIVFFDRSHHVFCIETK